jgi:hypothetical protein
MRADRSPLASCLLSILMFAMIAAFSGCSQLYGSNFSTGATYHAPTSGFQITISGEGFVPPGADVADKSEWEAVVTPLGSSAGKVITIRAQPDVPVRCIVDSQPAVDLPGGSMVSSGSLRRTLESAGYTNLSEAEIEEAARAIDGVAGGPKVMLLPGQTKSLTVVEATY